MKKMLNKAVFPFMLIMAASSAFAAADGFYLGGNLGWTRLDYGVTDFKYMSSASVDKTGTAGGINFGYQINQNFAAELGYTMFHRVAIKNIVLNSNPTGNTSLADGNVQTSAWDLAVKGMIPMNYGFGVNAKLGVARVQQKVGGGLNNSALGSDYESHTKFAPEAGFGASYDFSKNVSSGVNYTHIFKTGNIMPIDMVMANLSYHFG